jgi:hypothetical protein
MGANAVTTVPVYVAGEVLTAADMNITNSGIPVFASTVERDAAFGGTGEKTLAEGQFAYLEDTNTTQYYDGAVWQSVAATREIAIFNETQAANTSGGAATTGSFIKRTLNTTVVNTITSCTLTSSVISLPAGTYNILCIAPFVNTWRTKLKLRNTTDSTDALIGQSQRSDGGSAAYIQGQFTSVGTKNYEVQYRVEQNSGSLALGYEDNFGVVEIFTVIQIEKV